MIINFDHISKAEKYYKQLGYAKLSVPWIIGNEAYQATKPSQAGRDFTTLDGNLVASGEQSFLQILLDGKKIDRAQCSTPCFRDEKHDELHHPYFFKVELIKMSSLYYYDVIYDALEFFSTFLPVESIEIGKDEFDIIDSQFKIELGSYGIRKFKDFSWVYGTGLAEPRLTQVLGKLMMAV